MNIVPYENNIRTIKSDDPLFKICDKFVVAQRAGFEITSSCPREYKLIITECINNGWLKPVACMTERELLFVGLSQEK